MVTKPTSKRAARKTGAKKKSKAETKRNGAKRARPTKEEREAERATKKVVAKAEAEAKREAAAIERIQKKLAAEMARIEAASAAKAIKAAEAARKAEEKAKAAAAREEARSAKRAEFAATKAREVEERQAAAEAKRAEWAQKTNITDMDREKAQRLAYRVTASTWPREAWVAHIKDHKQRVLADATASICAIFGIPCDVLRADRKDQSPKSRNENSLRGMALGAVIDTGLTMGLGWNELHTHPEIGRSEVLDLPPHAATIRGAWGRWLATANIDGVLMDVMRARVAEVQAAAVKAAAGSK